MSRARSSPSLGLATRGATDARPKHRPRGPTARPAAGRLHHGLLGLALGLWATGSGPAAAALRGSLRSVRVELSEVTALSVELSPRCRAQVLAELTEGQRRDEGCGRDREAVGRALVRRGDAFGFVERRAVDLAELRLVLGEARRCRQWPLRSPDRDVLRRTDVDGAGCRLWRYQGEVTVVLVDRAGQRHEPLPPLRTDRDGRVTLRFSAVDRDLRALGRGTLDDYARIELGDAGWAGHVDLVQLLRFRADWHLTWLQRGRGAPGLFVARHPGHAGADEARTMSAEAELARQAQDFARVEAGELPAQAFLDRYPRSVYQHRVEAWLRARANEARRANAAAPRSAAEPADAAAPRSAAEPANAAAPRSAAEPADAAAPRSAAEPAEGGATGGEAQPPASTEPAAAGREGGGRRGGTTGGGGP